MSMFRNIKNIISRYLFTNYQIEYKNEKYFFLETFTGIYPTTPDATNISKKIYFTSSEDLKIELIELPKLNIKKTRNIIYYKLKSRYAESIDNLNFSFLILNKKNKNTIILFIYNKKILSTTNENYYFDIFPFIIYTKHHFEKNGLFYFALKTGFTIIVKRNNNITYIKFYKNKNDAEQYINNFIKNNNISVYSNINKIDNLKIFKLFIKHKEEIFYNFKSENLLTYFLNIFNKIFFFIIVSSFFIFIILYAFNDYINEKKNELQDEINKRKFILEKIGEIKKTVKEYNKKKLLLSKQSIYFYYLSQMTTAAQNKIFFISIDKPLHGKFIELEAYTLKSEYMKKFISELIKRKSFSKIELEQTEQYIMNNKNFIRFKLKVFI